jgi:hypothetical protein
MSQACSPHDGIIGSEPLGGRTGGNKLSHWGQALEGGIETMPVSLSLFLSLINLSSLAVVNLKYVVTMTESCLTQQVWAICLPPKKNSMKNQTISF